MRPGVALFPLTRDAAQRAVQKIALKSGRVSIPPEIAERGQWFERTTQRQVINCLREGTMTVDPRAGAANYWECQMERFCAGQLIRVDFAIGPMGNEECGIFVLNIEVE